MTARGQGSNEKETSWGQAQRAVLLARKAGDYGDESARTAVKRMADEAQPKSVYLVQVPPGP